MNSIPGPSFPHASLSQPLYLLREICLPSASKVILKLRALFHAQHDMTHKLSTPVFVALAFCALYGLLLLNNAQGIKMCWKLLSKPWRKAQSFNHLLNQVLYQIIMAPGSALQFPHLIINLGV